MLVNIKTILEIAEKNQNAVGAFNVASLDIKHKKNIKHSF